MSNIDTIREAIAVRKPTPQHVLFALFLASAAENGVLTQGSVSLLARTAAPKLREYILAMGGSLAEGKKGIDGLENLVKNLNTVLSISDEVRVEHNDNEASVLIRTNKCRYCPKGVGLAEIPGTLCPFPHLISELARLEGISAKIVVERRGARVEILKKHEGWCRIRFHIEESR